MHTSSSAARCRLILFCTRWERRFRGERSLSAGLRWSAAATAAAAAAAAERGQKCGKTRDENESSRMCLVQRRVLACLLPNRAARKMGERRGIAVYRTRSKKRMSKKTKVASDFKRG